MEPCLLLLLGTPHYGHTLVTISTYHINTTNMHTDQVGELVGSTKILRRNHQAHPLRKKLPSARNLHHMLLFGE